MRDVDEERKQSTTHRGYIKGAKRFVINTRSEKNRKNSMANRRRTTRGHDLLGKVGRVLAWPWMKSIGPWINVRPTTVDEDDDEATLMVKEMIGSRGSIEVQLVAFIIVFVASGLVPLEDALFVVFVTIYIFLLSCRCAFPAYPMTHITLQKSHETRKGIWRQTYIVVGTLLSFFLPLAFALGGFSRGNPDPARVATPHLFLSASQLLSELGISQYPRFSPPVRVILTLLYTTRCVFSLTNWMLQAFSLHQYSQVSSILLSLFMFFCTYFQPKLKI